MPARAFPDIAPSRGSRPSVQTRLKQAKFGDGYAQSAPDGLNHIEKTFEFQLRDAPIADCQTVLDFLEARAGHEPFTFQPFGYDAAVQWRCETWTEIDRVTATHGNMSAAFIRDFSP